MEQQERNAQTALIRPLAKPSELIEAHRQIVDFVENVLEHGVDYGVTEGTDKPTLFKAGAERLCLGFGLTPRITRTDVERDHGREFEWTKRKKKFKTRPDGSKQYEGETTESGKSTGYYRYSYKCEILSGDRVLSDVEGTCSTLESKYVDRPRECDNTVMRMAQKRAYVGAVAQALGLTGRFKVKSKGKAAAPAPDVKSKPDIFEHAEWRATYAGNPAQKQMISDHLAKEGIEISEALSREIHQAMIGRPCNDLRQVLIDFKLVRPK